MDIREKWNTLIALKQPKLKAVPQPVRAEPTQDELRAEYLSAWSQRPEVDKYFLPFLASLEKDYDANILKSRGNHAETNFWIGAKVNLEVLRIHLNAWRENRPPTPQEKGTTT